MSSGRLSGDATHGGPGARNRPIGLGEPAPWITCRCTSNERFHLNSVGGRYVVLTFFGSAADPDSAAVLAALKPLRNCFNDTDLCFFGVSSDPDDERLQRVREEIPGIRYFWDPDRAAAAEFGLAAPDGGVRKTTLILDPRLRVIGVIRFGNDGGRHAAQLFEILRRLPALGPEAPAVPQAPVLVVPHVFEPALCRRLIEVYEQIGGEDSGFMREVEGRTVGVLDHSFKRRRDVLLEDEALRSACRARIRDRLALELKKAFQFTASRIERYIVSCYDAGEGGYFKAHRDNTTRGTAHRRFAVSLFLNTGEYEGGFLQFPEFGRQLYSAPVGGAVVFSCALLHEATPVTKGRRYMFLPFLYDEEAARERAEYLRSAGAGESAQNPDHPAGAES